MSIQALSWSFKQEALTSSQKFVLVALANFASETLLAYPSVETICKITRQKDETVRNALKDLLADGLIVDTGKRVGDTQRIRVFRLVIPELNTPVLGGVKEGNTPPNTPPNTPLNGVFTNRNLGTLEPKERNTARAPAERVQGNRFSKPTLDEIKLQSAKIGLAEVEANKFFHHYESNGWRVGRSPMVSWHHALAGWKTRSSTYGGNSSHPTNGANTVIMGKEYERIVARINTLRSTYGDMQTWTAGDKAEFGRLKVRREELKKILGLTI